jgi:hypothetical protein
MHNFYEEKILCADEKAKRIFTSNKGAQAVMELGLLKDGLILRALFSRQQTAHEWGCIEQSQ